MISDYTTPDEIRAVLGVDVTDIDDTTLALPIYEKYLVMDLEDIAIDLPTTYATTRDLVSPTTAQTRFLATAQVFATFSLAKQLSSSLPLFALKQETDGKAQAARFDNSYADVVKSINESYARQRARLLAALSVIGNSGATPAPRSYMSIVNPSYDPIIGA